MKNGTHRMEKEEWGGHGCGLMRTGRIFMLIKRIIKMIIIDLHVDKTLFDSQRKVGSLGNIKETYFLDFFGDFLWRSPLDSRPRLCPPDDLLGDLWLLDLWPLDLLECWLLFNT